MAGITGTKRVHGKNHFMYLIGADNAITLIGCMSDFSRKKTIKQLETMCQELGLETDYEPSGINRTIDIGGISVDYTDLQVAAGAWGYDQWDEASDTGTVINVAIGNKVAGKKMKVYPLSIADLSEDSKIGDNVTYKVTANVKGKPTVLTVPNA
ncbi:hypothetical protein [Siphonobacter sp. BAB-5385]|uniref:hypothetical protein n=1 Tax=Siphonobacter sp. BAB-5385 TaxID=1864822 RepID=UPI000B9E47FD|nr:hypothetical protein [Siphonobacter sp. BAB-5385]